MSRTKYVVFVGYPEKGCDIVRVIQAEDQTDANRMAYGIWLGWGLYNDLDESNYYTEEVKDEQD